MVEGVPEVTFLMPICNVAAFLREAADSMLCQIFDDLEGLVVDDGSTDKAGELLSGYVGRRIRLICLERNSDVVEVLNTEVHQARAALIAGVDGADICEPPRLKLGIAFMLQQPKLLLLGTGSVRKDTAGRLSQRVV